MESQQPAANLFDGVGVYDYHLQGNHNEFGHIGMQPMVRMTIIRKGITTCEKWKSK